MAARHGEIAFSRGSIGSGAGGIDIFVHPETRTWTIFYTVRGLACLLSSGEQWEVTTELDEEGTAL